MASSGTVASAQTGGPGGGRHVAAQPVSRACPCAGIGAAVAGVVMVHRSVSRIRPDLQRPTGLSQCHLYQSVQQLIVCRLPACPDCSRYARSRAVLTVWAAGAVRIMIPAARAGLVAVLALVGYRHIPVRAAGTADRAAVSRHGRRARTSYALRNPHRTSHSLQLCLEYRRNL